MKRLIVLSLAMVVVVGVAFAQGGGNVTVRSMPPVVVKTIPQSGDTDDREHPRPGGQADVCAAGEAGAGKDLRRVDQP